MIIAIITHCTITTTRNSPSITGTSTATILIVAGAVMTGSVLSREVIVVTVCDSAVAVDSD